jgi:hypothetical protein
MRTPCQHCGSNYCVCPAGTSELHARIAQLEGIADARMTHIEGLEAALTLLTNGFKYSTEVVTIARKALAAAEPLVDLKDPHNAHHPDRLKGPGLTAAETKGDDNANSQG